MLAKYIVYQGPALSALGRVALSGVLQRLGGSQKQKKLVVPGQQVQTVLPPRPKSLVEAFLTHVGAQANAYRGTVPPSLFPQWALPIAASILQTTGYPLARTLNAGCRLELREPIPSGEPLHVSAQLTQVDDNGHRALLRVQVVTGTAKAPSALVGEITSYVPLERTKSQGTAKEPRRVPASAREQTTFLLARDAGLSFAELTGDFNPIHWLAPYARASGFDGVILHGFATMARSFEALHAQRPLSSMDVRFVRPLVLPAKVALFTDGDSNMYVGEGNRGLAYLEGTYTTA
ncbi:MAG: MaoC/PaaZ C-terminal domain-containing protein [Myxococcales bacterium]